MTEPPASPSRRWPLSFVLGAYLVLAFAAAWPLTADLGGTLPGAPSNDTGVYVWNLWAFRHQLIDHGLSPLWTDHILQPGPPVDLALHNYTIFQDLLALALIPWLGIVRSFNVIWIGMQALSGFAVYLLARRVTSRHAVAFVAGLLFAFSPTIIARSTAHQSLVAAAPLAFFLLFVLRAAESRSLREAALAGACAAWAAICDAYYGVYCIPVLVVVAIARVVSFEPLAVPRRHRALTTLLAGLMILPLSVIVVVLATGGGRIDVFGVAIRARTLYTPVLVLTILVAVRAAVALYSRGRWRTNGAVDKRRAAQVAAGTLVCGVLLAPLLNAAQVRVRSGGSLQEPVLWRSSPPGVDLLWFFAPNPNHPLVPDVVRQFVTTRPDSYPENVASIPFVALVVIGLALRREKAPIPYAALAVTFGLLALGPFVSVANLNTHIPGPWALLRYLPVLGAARTPTRFAIPMLIAIAVLFAWALERVGRRRLVLVTIAAFTVVELWPVPRLVASARVPAIYQTIAADTDDVTVLEIPFGIWDGTSQHGFANIATAYYQTTHQKRLGGGYLSRVPPGRVRELLEYPTLRAIAQLSEEKDVEPDLWNAAQARSSSFVSEANIRYVVIDPRLASVQLRDAAISLLRLRLVRSADGLELYRTDR